MKPRTSVETDRYMGAISMTDKKRSIDVAHSHTGEEYACRNPRSKVVMSMT